MRLPALMCLTMIMRPIWVWPLARGCKGVEERAEGGVGVLFFGPHKNFRVSQRLDGFRKWAWPKVRRRGWLDWEADLTGISETETAWGWPVWGWHTI